MAKIKKTIVNQQIENLKRQVMTNSNNIAHQNDRTTGVEKKFYKLGKAWDVVLRVLGTVLSLFIAVFGYMATRGLYNANNVLSSRPSFEAVLGCGALAVIIFVVAEALVWIIVNAISVNKIDVIENI